MKLPHDISAGAAARRALLADLLVAIGIALVASLLVAGVGILAVLALPALLALLAWIGIEAAARAARRRPGSTKVGRVAER